MFKRDWQFVDLLYSGMVADGSVLPLVLITNDKAVPKNVEGDSDAVVIYMPDITKPSAKTTLAALGAWQGMIVPGDHLIWDRGTEFNNQKVAEELQILRARAHFLPTGGGAFANPNDNSLFSQVEGRYKRTPKRNHVEAIRAMIAAYYSAQDEHIRNHFRNCLLTGSTPTRAQVKRLVEKSYRGQGAREREYQTFRDEFERFTKNSRLLSADVRRRAPPVQLPSSVLDGVKWNTYY